MDMFFSSKTLHNGLVWLLLFVIIFTSVILVNPHQAKANWLFNWEVFASSFKEDIVDAIQSVIANAIKTIIINRVNKYIKVAVKKVQGVIDDWKQQLVDEVDKAGIAYLSYFVRQCINSRLDFDSSLQLAFGEPEQQRKPLCPTEPRTVEYTKPNGETETVEVRGAGQAFASWNDFIKRNLNEQDNSIGQFLMLSNTIEGGRERAGRIQIGSSLGDGIKPVTDKNGKVQLQPFEIRPVAEGGAMAYFDIPVFEDNWLAVVLSQTIVSIVVSYLEAGVQKVDQAFTKAEQDSGLI